VINKYIPTSSYHDNLLNILKEETDEYNEKEEMEKRIRENIEKKKIISYNEIFRGIIKLYKDTKCHIDVNEVEKLIDFHDNNRDFKIEILKLLI
jgi:hypothetical protein